MPFAHRSQGGSSKQAHLYSGSYHLILHLPNCFCCRPAQRLSQHCLSRLPLKIFTGLLNPKNQLQAFKCLHSVIPPYATCACACDGQTPNTGCASLQSALRTATRPLISAAGVQSTCTAPFSALSICSCSSEASLRSFWPSSSHWAWPWASSASAPSACRKHPSQVLLTRLLLDHSCCPSQQCVAAMTCSEEPASQHA